MPSIENNNAENPEVLLKQDIQDDSDHVTNTNCEDNTDHTETADMQDCNSEDKDITNGKTSTFENASNQDTQVSVNSNAANGDEMDLLSQLHSLKEQVHKLKSDHDLNGQDSSIEKAIPSLAESDMAKNEQDRGHLATQLSQVCPSFLHLVDVFYIIVIHMVFWMTYSSNHTKVDSHHPILCSMPSLKT